MSEWERMKQEENFPFIFIPSLMNNPHLIKLKFPHLPQIKFSFSPFDAHFSLSHSHLGELGVRWDSEQITTITAKTK